MGLKKLSNLFSFVIRISLLLVFSLSVLAEESSDATVITLTTNEEFTFAENSAATFTIKPLRDTHRSIETLADVEALGIIYIGEIVLTNEATPLSALRNIAAQISKALNLDLALITDSTTSQSLEPHELLLLYHPILTVTLALTKTEADHQYSLIGTYSMSSQSQEHVVESASETNASQ